MVSPAPAAPASLQGFAVELRTPDGTELRYVTAPDVIQASALAVGAMAIELPEAEVVAVRHLGPALTR